MIVWHYTIGSRLKAIREYGALRPATAGVPAHELPVLWFSSRRDFEPTARKMLVNSDGQLRRLSVDETAHWGEGLIRFGISSDRCIRWPDLRRRCHMRSKDARQLEAAAHAIGAIPTQWFGVIGELPLSAVSALERLDGVAWREEITGPADPGVGEPAHVNAPAA